MKANKDPKIEIKETDKDSVHVKLIRRVGTANEPQIYEDIQIYDPRDFANMLTFIDKHGIGVTGYHEMIVVHDPKLEVAKVEAKPKPKPKPNSPSK